VATRFSAPVQTYPGTHLVSYKMSTVASLGVKRLARGADHPLSQLEPRLKKEYSYIPTIPSGTSLAVLG